MSSTADINVVGHIPLEVYQPTKDTATLPTQAVVNPDPAGAPAILYEAALPPTVKFSINQPVGPEIMPDTYQIAVRCTGPSGDVLRYVLVEPTAHAILFPAYDGHTLYPPATLEVWSVTDEALADIAEDIVLIFGTYTRPATANMINSYGLPISNNTVL